jgi:hypothetical protein
VVGASCCSALAPVIGDTLDRPEHYLTASNADALDLTTRKDVHTALPPGVPSPPRPALD